MGRVVAALSRTANEIIVVTAPHQVLPAMPQGIKVVEDLVGGLGPVGGLYTGLQAMLGECACVVACDMPFLDSALVALLISLIQGHDAVVPCVAGRLQSLHAAYSRSCLPALRELLKQDNVSLRDLLAHLDVRYLKEGDLEDSGRWLRSSFNINTQEDLELAMSWLASTKWQRGL